MDVSTWYTSAGTAKEKSKFLLLPGSWRDFVTVVYDLGTFCGHPEARSAVATSS